MLCCVVLQKVTIEVATRSGVDVAKPQVAGCSYQTVMLFRLWHGGNKATERKQSFGNHFIHCVMLSS